MQGCFMPKYSHLKPEQEQLPAQSCITLFQIPFHFPALHCFSWSQTVHLCFNQSTSASVQQKKDSLCSKIVLKNQLKSEPSVIWSIHTYNLCWQKVQGEEEQGKEEESVQGSVHNAHSWKQNHTKDKQFENIIQINRSQISASMLLQKGRK